MWLILTNPPVMLFVVGAAMWLASLGLLGD
jgi:hypothetical protein